MQRTGGLIVPEEPYEPGLGFVAGLLALVAAGIGSARYLAELGPAWGWIALGIGAFACGMALVRIVTKRLRDFGDIMSGFGALAMGGAAIAGVSEPVVPTIGIGVWLVGWIVEIMFFEW